MNYKTFTTMLVPGCVDRRHGPLSNQLLLAHQQPGGQTSSNDEEMDAAKLQEYARLTLAEMVQGVSHGAIYIHGVRRVNCVCRCASGRREGTDTEILLSSPRGGPPCD